MKFKELLELLPSHLLLDVSYQNVTQYFDVRLALKFTSFLDKKIVSITPQVFLDTNTIENDQVSIFGNVKLDIVLE